jgi:hypothetical protein
MARQPLVVLGLPIVEASRSHSDTPYSVGVLWVGDQPFAETSPHDNTTAVRRDTHSMPPARFEPAIQASERPQTHTLVLVATGIGPF